MLETKEIVAEVYAKEKLCITGAEIRRLREINGFSRVQLAVQLGRTAPEIAGYEKSVEVEMSRENMGALLYSLRAMPANRIL